MTSRDRKRPAPPSNKGQKCPSRFVPTPARKQPGLPWMPRAGYDHELGKDSQLLRAAKNFYPEGKYTLPMHYFSRQEKNRRCGFYFYALILS